MSCGSRPSRVARWIVRDPATGHVVAVGESALSAFRTARRIGFTSGVARTATAWEVALLDIRPDGAVVLSPCSVCGGTGKFGIVVRECNRCGGTGRVSSL